MHKRRRSLFGSALGAIIHIIALPPPAGTVVLSMKPPQPYATGGKPQRHPPLNKGRNPGPSRARRYYNKGGKCH